MDSREKCLDRFGGLYQLLDCERHSDGYALCTYRGETATELDHVPPVTRVDDYRGLAVAHERYWKVRACKDCNKLLGSTLQRDVLERVEELKTLLSKKRLKLSKTEWTETELAQLGKNLRSRILASMSKTDILDIRINYYGGVKAILSAYPDEYET